MIVHASPLLARLAPLALWHRLSVSPSFLPTVSIPCIHRHLDTSLHIQDLSYTTALCCMKCHDVFRGSHRLTGFHATNMTWPLPMFFINRSVALIFQSFCLLPSQDCLTLICSSCFETSQLWSKATSHWLSSVITSQSSSIATPSIMNVACSLCRGYDMTSRFSRTPSSVCRKWRVRSVRDRDVRTRILLIFTITLR